MTPSQVLDVASILAHLRRLHGIDTDPVEGPLRAEDFRFIAESVDNDANTFDAARTLATRIQSRGKR